jgi:hypothetical protein
MCKACVARTWTKRQQQEHPVLVDTRALKAARAPTSSWWAVKDRATFNENLARERDRLRLAWSKVEEVL